MTDKMTHMERGLAALSGEAVDRLTVYPIACGVCRKLLPGDVTYQQWVSDPKLFGQAFVAGQKRFGFDFAIGLMDLSVMAGDLGAHVRMDEENTPFVDEHIVKDVEDYEKIEAPDIRKGRSNVLIEGTRYFAKELAGQVVTAGFLEGPLLALSQSAGAERLFMDIFSSPSAVHKALEVTSAYDTEMIKAFGTTGINGLCWDYLWANYSCLGDSEYKEFERDYADKLNDIVRREGMAVCIHNCADLPHLDTQILHYKPAIYSMAYYPLIPGSPTAAEVIEKGYADHCLVAGQIDPQVFIRGSAETVTKVTKDLCQEVKTSLCKRGLKSQYCIASGCEVPPDRRTKMENIEAMVDATKAYGVF
ncbi:MAG: uroporphyrinogen decarboxylase family protein [archaeon]|nr:uroporphyrinogen decarboxylase family protein [archaeon]